jgi:hypothetical protein
MLYWSSCQVPVILSDFNETRTFLERFSKNTQISNLMTIRPVEPELFHADGRTDRYDEANSPFPRFCASA